MFLLFYILFNFLHCLPKKNNNPEEIKFDSSLSLYSPYVEENGASKFYEFNGDFVIATSHMDNSYIQLGYQDEDSIGLVRLKSPIRSSSYIFNISISYNPAKLANGIGFWLGEELDIGSYYGIDKTKFKGYGIIFDFKKNFIAKFVNSYSTNKTLDVKVNNFDPENNILLKVQNGNLKFEISVNSKRFLLFDVDIQKSNNLKFGITASTGSSENGFLILKKIIGYNIRNSKIRYPKGNTKKSKKMVLFIGIISIAGLLYYRFSNLKNLIKADK